jgi:hypothetical protein
MKWIWLIEYQSKSVYLKEEWCCWNEKIHFYKFGFLFTVMLLLGIGFDEEGNSPGKTIVGLGIW